MPLLERSRMVAVPSHPARAEHVVRLTATLGKVVVIDAVPCITSRQDKKNVSLRHTDRPVISRDDSPILR
jgi:hypothetical protein